jgi:hypothetical protein
MRHPTSASSQRILVPTRLSDAVIAGMSRDALKRDVDAGRLRRPFRGVYAPPEIGSRQEQIRCAALHTGPESIIVIGSGAVLHGLAGIPLRHVPQLALPPGLERRQRDGIDLHFWDIPESEVTTVDGQRVTSLLRTVADVCRLLPRFAAVSCVDSALDQGLLSLDDLDALRALMARRRNCVAGRRHAAEARVGAQSPLETRVRLRADDGGLPPDELQVPVFSVGGVLLGYGDMGYRLPSGGWLIVEADGHSVHERPEALLHDRRRQNAFVGESDITMVRFTWEDTRHDAYIPGVLRPILMRSGWRPPHRRT